MVDSPASPERNHFVRLRGIVTAVAALGVAIVLFGIVSLHEYQSAADDAGRTVEQVSRSAASRLGHVLSRVELLTQLISARTASARKPMQVSEALIALGQFMPEAHAILLLDNGGRILGSSQFVLDPARYGGQAWFEATRASAPSTIHVGAMHAEDGAKEVVLSTRLAGTSSRVVAFVFKRRAFAELMIPAWIPSRVGVTIANTLGESLFAAAPSEATGRAVGSFFTHPFTFLPPRTIDAVARLPSAGLDVQAAFHGRLPLQAGKVNSLSFVLELAVGVLALGLMSVLAGMLVGSGARARDIRATRQATEARHEAETRRLREEKERIREDRDRVLASVGHDVRTPLTSILGATTILEELDLEDDHRRWIAKIGASARTLLAMLNGLLDMARGEAGETAVAREDVDLVSLIRDVCGMLESGAHDKGLRLECSIEDGVQGLWRTDASRVRVILVNLINNAIRYTSAGEVEVTARVTAEAVGTYVQLRVRDTGPGIPDDEREVIFERFRRGSQVARSPEGGLGLGLALCRDNAKAIGGTLTLESTVFAGSSFALSFPAERVGAVEQPAFSKGMSAVIVGFTEGYRRALTRHLQAVGSVVETAPDGYIGLGVVERAFARIGGVDVLIIDTEMSGMPGLAFVKRVRAARSFAKVRLIGVGGTQDPLWSEAPLDALVPQPGGWVNISAAVRRIMQDWSPLETLVPDAPNAPCARILVVEDDPTALAVIKDVLARRGFTVFTATSGEDAVRVCGHADFAAILMDIELGGISGYEAARQIRALGRTVAKVPILALTATPGELAAKRASEAGMTLVMEKPVDPQRIAEKVRSCIAGAGSAADDQVQTGRGDEGRLGVSRSFLLAMVAEVGTARARPMLDAFLADAGARATRLMELVVAGEKGPALRGCRELAELAEPFGATAFCEALEELGAALERGEAEVVQMCAAQTEAAIAKLGPTLGAELDSILAEGDRKAA